MTSSRKIPLKISPFFWVTAAIIGWINSLTFMGTLVWIAIIFFSILFHELGHALTSRFFGQSPRIELIAFGGLTYPEGPKLPLWKEFIVVLDGPIFGFMLFLAGFVLLRANVFTSPFALYFLQTLTMINLFWTIVNLLPVLPLDGGQLLRIIFEAVFGIKGWKYALYGSILVAIVISIIAVIYQQFFIAAFFFLFAFQNIDTLRRTKHITEVDRNEDIKGELKQTEALIDQGKIDEAIPRLEDIRNRSKRGMIYIFTTEYLARLKMRKGEAEAAYHLLLPIRKHLSPDSVVILHQVAYQMQDYMLVDELSGVCFQYAPTPDVALRSAEASATLKKVSASIGWLQAALKAGALDLQKILSDKTFDPIREDPTFKKFVDNL